MTSSKETYLNPSSRKEENISWDEAVSKVSRVIEDVCKDYEKDGHPYYSTFYYMLFLL